MIRKRKVFQSLLICFFLFSFQLFAQIDTRAIPENTIALSYYKYLAKNEVTTGDWKYFLEVILQDSSATLFDKMTPDTAAISKEWELTSAGEYFYGKKYENHPVVGVSWIQAKKYCEWLTSKYNYEQAVNYNPLKFKKVELRLPTKEEWQQSCDMENLIYAFGNIANPKYMHSLDFVSSKSKKVAKTVSIFEKEVAMNQTRNMNGNVAEMIAVNGIALGGSWKDEASKCTNYSRQNYYGPSSWVGFRFLIDVIEE